MHGKIYLRSNDFYLPYPPCFASPFASAYLSIFRLFDSDSLLSDSAFALVRYLTRRKGEGGSRTDQQIRHELFPQTSVIAHQQRIVLDMPLPFYNYQITSASELQRRRNWLRPYRSLLLRLRANLPASYIFSTDLSPPNLDPGSFLFLALVLPP